MILSNDNYMEDTDFSSWDIIIVTEKNLKNKISNKQTYFINDMSNLGKELIHILCETFLKDECGGE